MGDAPPLGLVAPGDAGPGEDRSMLGAGLGSPGWWRVSAWITPAHPAPTQGGQQT